MRKRFKALLLAGGKSKPALRKVTGQEYKALITINALHPKSMIDHTLEILQNSKYISRIFIAAPEELRQQISFDKKAFTPSGSTLMDTLRLSLPYFQDENHVLVSTCDLPLISSRHIEHFMEDCLAIWGFDIYYPIINKQTYAQSFPDPDLRRIYANLIEGSFTGGNMFLVNPRVVIDCSRIIEQFILFRKHPLKMARILGRRIVAKYLKRYLSIRDLEKMVPDYLKGYTGKAVISDPEIALDLDKPMQLEALRTLKKDGAC